MSHLEVLLKVCVSTANQVINIILPHFIVKNDKIEDMKEKFKYGAGLIPTTFIDYIVKRAYLNVTFRTSQYIVLFR